MRGIKGTCNDCDQASDPRFEMDFSDLGEGPLEWCAEHGPDAHAMNDALQRMLLSDPKFAAKLDAEITKVEKRRN